MARFAAVVLLLPQLLGGVYRLPVCLTVVDGRHVLGALDVVPVHALHAPGVKDVGIIKPEEFFLFT